MMSRNENKPFVPKKNIPIHPNHPAPADPQYSALDTGAFHSLICFSQAFVSFKDLKKNTKQKIKIKTVTINPIR